MAQGKSPRNPMAFASVLLPRKVPGLSANPLGFRGGGGAAVQEREAVASPPSSHIPSPPPGLSHLAAKRFFFIWYHRRLWEEDMAFHSSSVKV